MYPNLYYAVKGLFGVDIGWLRAVPTFGFFMMGAFLAAGAVFRVELRRKASEGLMGYEEEEVRVRRRTAEAARERLDADGVREGMAARGDMGGADAESEGVREDAGDEVRGAARDEREREDAGRADESGEWEERVIRVWAYDRVGEFMVLAVVFGFLGAKLFNGLENWNALMRDPIGTLLSLSGLTFYGGLIFATLAIWWYARRHHIPLRPLNDAAAPMLALAYAIGRLGCHFSGDGDWGILNTAYTSMATGKVAPMPGGVETFNDFGSIRHWSVRAPSWLPDGLFASCYPHNINNVGLRLSNCVGDHCMYLPSPVFPTSVYESLMGLLIFGVLWFLRRRLRVPGALFCWYLVLMGVERLLIEQIRVNAVFELFGWRLTQAELISAGLVLAGGVGLIVLGRRPREEFKI